MTVFIVLVVLLAVVPVCAVSCYAMNVMRDALQASEANTTKVIQAIAILKGLTPHQAAPQEIAPPGVPYEFLERQKSQVVDTAAAKAKARKIQMINDARAQFEARGNAGKVAEMDLELERIRNGAA